MDGTAAITPNIRNIITKRFMTLLLSVHDVPQRKVQYRGCLNACPLVPTGLVQSAFHFIVAHLAGGIVFIERVASLDPVRFDAPAPMHGQAGQTY
jgi:hypothetical protein